MSLPQRPKDAATDSMESLPPGVRLPEPPPPDFDPMKVTDDLLVKHGLPPRPDPTSEPESYAWWMKVCSRARVYIRPGFESLSQPTPPSAEEIRKRWSGAVIAADKGYHFTQVYGSWTISRPFPDNRAWKTMYWNSGRFNAASWVGIDGHKTPDLVESHDVLQAGTAHTCVTSTHQDTEYTTYPWWEWYPDHPWALTGFQVKPGDLIHVNIRATSSTEAIVYFYNDSACTYTSFSVTAPPNVSLVGNCAEWIVEASRESSADQPTTSYLGATFFFDCLAIEKKNRSLQSRDLTNATFLEAVQDGEVLSTGRQDLSNNKVVGIVAEDRTNWTKVSHRKEK